MGLLSRLRAWIGGSTGDDESAESPTDAEGAAEGETEGGAGDEPTGLDPSAATETRTAATDDAVDALRDVRRSQDASPVEEDAGEEAEDAVADDRDGP